MLQDVQIFPQLRKMVFIKDGNVKIIQIPLIKEFYRLKLKFN